MIEILLGKVLIDKSTRFLRERVTQPLSVMVSLRPSKEDKMERVLYNDGLPLGHRNKIHSTTDLSVLDMVQNPPRHRGGIA